MAEEFDTLGTQIPRLQNLAPVPVTNQLAAINARLTTIEGTINARLTTTKARLTTTEARLTTIEARLTRIENSIEDLSIISEDRFLNIEDQLTAIDGQFITIRTEAENARIKTRNTHRFALNFHSVLEPLRDLGTGAIIPNCPRTSAAIGRLPPADANRILDALQIIPPATLLEKREAVRQAFF
ncbi:hypothetical protein QBC46DRAFT_106641 [Diplogelasinospora grovesii]|uniref:Uncharacterized protein n=1 Tax=Diplogelasinospora grovesii TaxID=303347 RepID=A0AAN6NAM8_9PEZI|nr:hypothetical protein QBC46DRAFT_106641 [Diplogelasinospora grovesii]